MSTDLGSIPSSTAPTSPRSPTSTDGFVDCEKGNGLSIYDEKAINNNGNGIAGCERLRLQLVLNKKLTSAIST